MIALRDGQLWRDSTTQAALGTVSEDEASPTVAIAHDYITQRGGAERVVLCLAQIFPQASISTLLYDSDSSYPEFSERKVLVSPLNSVSYFRKNHRAALPILAFASQRMTVRADVAIVSSSGWAHGMQTTGKKIIYCHAPARWLYQESRYLRSRNGGLSARLAQILLRALRPYLMSWDKSAARSADRYVVNSTTTQEYVRQAYGIEAEVVHPPAGLLDSGESSEVAVEGNYLLCVARLLPYKNVDRVIAAAQFAHRQLVVVGDGPDYQRLRGLIDDSDSVLFLRNVNDSELRWLYRNCDALVAASFEDFGLSPVEAAQFGKPTAALRAGGYLDTVVPGLNGVFFDALDPSSMGTAFDELARHEWQPNLIREHAAQFSAESFAAKMSRIVRDISGEQA